MFGFSEEEIQEFHYKVSQNVRKYRQDKSFTQLDLALELGLKNSSFIYHAENPKITTHHYSLEHLYKISKILDVDISLFFK
ncbi:MAG: helix-turn-helix transcriptional regulator [Arcobacteraceae bacterium]